MKAEDARDAGPAAMLRTHRVVATVGTGGVGKTTVAAALGLCAARLGMRALVLTIDPAKRLADALGARTLGAEPEALARESLTAVGVPPEGSLSAMMLDMKHTFDALVERFAESPAVQERILANPIYQHVSDALAGSAEYSAMEKVHELSEHLEFDVIILDTPPSAHALDFLEAPERLIGLLDSRLVQLLLHPAMSAGRFGLRIFQRGAHRIFRILERVSGLAFLEDISEFLLAFEGMAEGFRARAAEVRELLFGPATAFVLTMAPAASSVAQAEAFMDRLTAAGVELAGLVQNRVHRWPGNGPGPKPFDPDRVHSLLARDLARGGLAPAQAEAGARAALALLDSYAAGVRRDAAAPGQLLARASRRAERHGGGWFVRRIAELPEDIHDLGGLAKVADQLIPPRERDGVARTPDAPLEPR